LQNIEGLISGEEKRGITLNRIDIQTMDKQMIKREALWNK
jgi:hypothetical protein